MSKKRKTNKYKEVIEEMTEEVLDKVIEEPVEEVLDKVSEEVIEESAEEVLDKVLDEVVVEPMEEVLDKVLDEVIEEPVEEVLDEVVEERIRTLKVTAEKLNVREEPNPDSSVLIVVNKNDIFKIIDETPLYFGIQVNDNTIGYCKKDFVKECE